MVGLALKKLDLNQEVFIIKLRQLFQECGTISKNRFVFASVIIEPNQTSFQSLNNKRDQNLIFFGFDLTCLKKILFSSVAH